MNNVVENLHQVFGLDGFNKILNFSEQRNLNQFDILIEKGRQLNFVYVVIEGHYLKYINDRVVSIYSPGDVIGASIVFDLSKSKHIMDGDVIATDKNNIALIITIDEIKKLTENNTVFNWVIQNMKKERNHI